MSDPIRICPRCGEYRHISQFQMGVRHCRFCDDEDPYWLDSLARAVVKAEAAERERQAAIKAEVAAMASGTKPPELTGSEWRALHRIDRGEDVAEKSDLLEKVIGLAQKRLGEANAENR